MAEKVAYSIIAGLPKDTDYSLARSIAKKYSIIFDQNYPIGYNEDGGVNSPAFVVILEGGFIGPEEIEKIQGRINRAVEDLKSSSIRVTS